MSCARSPSPSPPPAARADRWDAGCEYATSKGRVRRALMEPENIGNYRTELFTLGLILLSSARPKPGQTVAFCWNFEALIFPPSLNLILKSHQKS